MTKKGHRDEKEKMNGKMKELTLLLNDGLDNMVNVMMYVLVHYSAFIKSDVLLGKASLTNCQR